MDAPSEVPTLRLLDEDGRATMFTGARTARNFLDRPVSDEQLREIWELARWAPTSRDHQPLRIVFIRSDEGRSRLYAHLDEHNRPKSKSAGAIALLAVDLDFHDTIPRLTPSTPEKRDVYADETYRHEFAYFNATLQVGYFILAVRAVGLSAGPMAGFDNAAMDNEFFSGTAYRSLLVVNIGHPSDKAYRARGPRLDHDEVITWA